MGNHELEVPDIEIPIEVRLPLMQPDERRRFFVSGTTDVAEIIQETELWVPEDRTIQTATFQTVHEIPEFSASLDLAPERPYVVKKVPLGNPQRNPEIEEISPFIEEPSQEDIEQAAAAELVAMLAKAAEALDKDTFEAELERAKEMAQQASLEGNYFVPTTKQSKLFDIKPKPEITPGQKRRAIVFGELVRNIDTWQLALHQGHTPTAVIDGDDGSKQRVMVITQDILDGLKLEALNIYTNELSSSPKAKALADEALAALAPKADEVLDAIDWSYSPERRAIETRKKNERLIEEATKKIALLKEQLEQKKGKTKRLPDKIRSWIEKRIPFFKNKQQPVDHTADINESIKAMEAIVHLYRTTAEKINKTDPTTTPSAEASKYINDLLDKDL